MRILVINHFPLEGSGSGIYTRNVARELSEMGHDVKVIFPEHTDITYDGFESRVIKFKTEGNVNYDLPYNFPCFTSHPRSVNTYYNLNDEQIEQYVDKFMEVTLDEVEKFKPDVIHAQHLWVTPYVASKTGIPYVVTAHGTDLKGFVKDDRYHKYALEGAKHAKKIVTISKQVDREVEELYGVEKERRQLIMNGYDENLFKPFEMDRHDTLLKYDIDYHPDYIVSFAGKFAHFKGIDVLLKAAKIYENEVEGKVLTLIAGNGELYGELSKLKDELGLQNTHFLGHVNQSQLVEIYNLADVSTVPSRTEPFGLVAIEAMACGTPVVGTNQGGLPDFVTDEVGALVDVEDEVSLAEAIMSELNRPDKQTRAKTAYEYALNNFSWKKSIVNLEELYKQIV